MAAQRVFAAGLLLAIAVVAPGTAQQTESEARTRYMEATRRDCEDKKLLSQCYVLGGAYFDGYGLPQSDTLAIELFQRACDGGYMRACTELGSMYASGSGGFRQSTGQAVELYSRACDRGDPYGCGNLGVAYASGLGVKQSEEQATELFRRACAASEPIGCVSLATRDKKSRLMPLRDLELSVDRSQRACESGEYVMCVALGRDYRLGRGVPRSDSRAKALFVRACDNGSMEGCYDAGEKAKACAGGYLPACGELGNSEFWNGVKDNGVRMLKRTCGAGDLAACADLGWLYLSGSAMGLKERLDVDPHELFRKACDGGISGGCYYLGMAYRGRGLGVKGNEQRSLEFFRRACDLGNSKSCKQLFDMSEKKPEHAPAGAQTESTSGAKV